MDEITKQKYIYLKNRMYGIRQNLSVSIDLYNGLLSDLKKGILINNEIPQNNDFNKELNRLKDVKTEVTNQVLASINNKI